MQAECVLEHGFLCVFLDHKVRVKIRKSDSLYIHSVLTSVPHNSVCYTQSHAMDNKHKTQLATYSGVTITVVIIHTHAHTHTCTSTHTCTPHTHVYVHTHTQMCAETKHIGLGL